MSARKKTNPQAKPKGRLRAARGWIAGGVIAALIVTVAVVANGFDAREVLRKEPNVWVARDAGQYARVNTETGEIDTVRKVSEPSGVLQIGSHSVVLTNGNGRAWPVNASLPIDLVESGGGTDDTDATDDAAAAEPEGEAATASESSGTSGSEPIRMPDGTRDVIVSGNHVLLRTETGAVYVGAIDSGELAGFGAATDTDLFASQLKSLQQIDPLAEEAAAAAAAAAEEAAGKDAEEAPDQSEAEQLGLRVDAVAISEGGTAALYSATDGTIWRYDATDGTFMGGATKLPKEAAGLKEAQLAIISGEWVLLDPESGTLWRQGGDPVTVKFSGSPKLQASGEGEGQGGVDVLVADVSGLWQVPKQGDAKRILEADGLPAQPRQVGDERFAAWIGQNGGTLWSTTDGERQLDYDEAAGDLGEASPVFYTNGDRAILAETRTGMLWTLPGGRLIPLSQWSISDPPKEDQGTVVVEEVTEQVPPTAVSDAFGVRQGEPAPLPVLLNDFDANKRDVLTIVADSIGENPLPESFGTVELAADAQSFMVRPSPTASGTASFTYRLSDGALTSEAATVTLTVVDESTNSAPEWCPVEGCQRAWSVPEIAPGGTLVYPILEGWVDPEGDPMMLAEVELLRPEDPATALITADGRLAVRHTDVNAGASEIMMRLTVRDSRGAEQQRELQVSVQPGASAEFAATAATVQVSEMTILKPLERVAGGSGSFLLTDVTVQSGAERVKVLPRTSDGSIEVTATSAGEAVLSLGVRDIVTGNEITGLIRITATPGAAPLTLPPLRAFVRPLSDSSVEILEAIPGASARALAVQSVSIIDGDLRADVIEHSRVRVAGSTTDGGPGRIGSADVTVTEGTVGTQGRLTVFQVPESGSQGAIAVADSASVRAGSVVDIRVLDNDVASPGERLILHPEVTGSGTEGELAFASGSTLRYLAPKQPGTYRLSYTTYGASSPEAGDVGTVTVNVLPGGANQDPHPATVSARVAPSEQTEVKVPLSGVDPDGDRVRLVGVGQLDDPQLTASVSPNGTSLTVIASGQAEPGLRTVEYTVRDGEGGSGTGVLRIIVTSLSDDVGAPIASSDYVRVVRGGADPVVVRPLDNDIDPARGKLRLQSVEPNVPGGESNPEYAAMMSRLDLTHIKQGYVLITPGEELGTVSYRYTVKSSVSSSSSDGLLLVQTSERVGAQAPTVTDTVLNVRERGELEKKGVDVVTDKVRWAAGDASALELSLWDGNKGGYSVAGDRIKGSYNPDGDLVAFRLSGVDASGAEVTSYGFLIIPPLDELRVTLKPGAEAIRVKENKSVDVKIHSFVDVSSGDRIEMAQESFPVGRSQASCAATSAEELRYTAGAEQPWEDTCLVNVRLVGQKNWTALPLPVMIEPREPVVQLTALTRTVPPGSSETIDLQDMVKWQGDRAGDMGSLKFVVTGGGSLFDVAQSGSSVTVDARADATTGSQESLTVSVTGSGESQAPFTLRIGEAPRDNPRGGTVNLQCTVGSNCAIDVIGAPGEYDPFAGKKGSGLKLDTVSGASCTFGTVSKASERGVTVAWPDNRGPGGRCTIGYTVRDAQNRVGEGSIELDAQGVPRAPASLTPQSYGSDSVTFIVELGAAQNAHPSVTGVEVTGAGSGSCAPAGPASYQCVVSGLENGVQHSFTARAINSVGSSDPSTSATAWAYRTPEPPEITQLVAVQDSQVTQVTGVIEFSLSGQNDVAGYQVSVGGVTREYTGKNLTKERLVVPVGGQQFQVKSLSRFQPPQGAPIQGAAITEPVKVAGSPIAGSVSLGAPTTTSLKASMGGTDANYAEQAELRYQFTIKKGGWFAGDPAGCSQNPNDYGANDQVFDGLKTNATYKIRGCVFNGYGFAEAAIVAGSPQVVGGGSVPAPNGQLQFSVGTAGPQVPSTEWTYGIVTEATPQPSAGAFLEFRVNGVVSNSFVHDPNDASAIEVRQCFEANDEDSCSQWHALGWTGAPTVVKAQLTGACIPTGNASSAVNISGAALPFATVTGENTGKLTITWGGSFGGLQPLVLNGTACDPPPPDPVDPPPAP